MLNFVDYNGVDVVNGDVPMYEIAAGNSAEELEDTDLESAEVNSETKYPVIHLMPEQEEYLKKHQYGGTIRLGNWPCKIKKGTKLAEIYKENVVEERHRHRYEFNNEYRKQLEDAGLTASGVNPDTGLVEIIELKNHPFFIGVQYHPEYKSTVANPHPIFVSFVAAMVKHKK